MKANTPNENIKKSTNTLNHNPSNTYQDNNPLFLKKLCGENDPSEYKEFTLSNGMRVILVKHEESAQPAMALSIWMGLRQ